MEYIVVENEWLRGQGRYENKEEFCQRVTRMMQAGYKLQGGVSVYCAKLNDGGRQEMFHQAMYKSESAHGEG